MDPGFMNKKKGNLNDVFFCEDTFSLVTKVVLQ